jgi:hypothetical protein
MFSLGATDFGLRDDLAVLPFLGLNNRFSFSFIHIYGNGTIHDSNCFEIPDELLAQFCFCTKQAFPFMGLVN